MISLVFTQDEMHDITYKCIDEMRFHCLIQRAWEFFDKTCEQESAPTV